jgi:hypothetical protein
VKKLLRKAGVSDDAVQVCWQVAPSAATTKPVPSTGAAFAEPAGAVVHQSNAEHMAHPLRCHKTNCASKLAKQSARMS